MSVCSCSASLEIVLVHGGDDDDTAAAGEEDAPHSDEQSKFVTRYCVIAQIFLPLMMRMLSRI